MPLYYFNIRNGDRLELDPEGMEFPDIRAAYLEALRVARELLGELPDIGRETVIEITYQAKCIVRTVPFSEAIQS